MCLVLSEVCCACGLENMHRYSECLTAFKAAWNFRVPCVLTCAVLRLSGLLHLPASSPYPLSLPVP